MVDADFWRGRRVFLTGHTGFKGAWLSLWLRRLGAEVFGYALEPPTRPSLHVLAGGTDAHVGDVRNLQELAGALAAAKPEIVFHLAAQSLVRESYKDPIGTLATNVMGTAHVLEAIRGLDCVRATVVVTSDKCYRPKSGGSALNETDPLGGDEPYSASKGGAELVTRAYVESFGGPPTATARAGNVIGGGDFATDRLVPDVVRAIESGQPLLLRYPDAVRPWQHVLDPLAGYLGLAARLCLDGHKFSGAWNFGPDHALEVPVIEIVERLHRITGGAFRYQVERQPQPAEAPWISLDSTKARERLGWRPRLDLDGSLRWTVEWHGMLRSQPGAARAICHRQIDAFMQAPAELAAT